MATIRELLVKDLKRSIEMYQEWLTRSQNDLEIYEDASLAWADVEVPDTSTVNASIYPQVFIPWQHVGNDEIVAHISDFLGAPTKSEETLSGQANLIKTKVVFALPNRTCGLELHFMPGRNGSSCKLVQIGTKTIEQPIYEMRCGEEPTSQEQVA